MPWRWLVLALLVTVSCDTSDPDPVASCEMPSADCLVLCEDLCNRLGECTMPAEYSCLSECQAAYTCVGETPDQDDAICRNRLAMSEGLSCRELCAENSFGLICPL